MVYKFEIVLFLEHIPYTLQPWLLEHPDQVDWVLEDLRSTIDFLRKQGILHLDAHFYNMLTDCERVYLTDFGLVLDRNFSLQEDERAFFQTHTHYDYGLFLSNLIFPDYELYSMLPEQTQRQLRQKYGIPDEGNQFHTLLSVLIEHVEEIDARGIIKLDKTYLASIVKHRNILLLMGRFFADMRGNPQKDTPFPHEELRRLLNDVGYITDTFQARQD